MITSLRCSGMAYILKGSHSFTCTPRVHPLTKWTIPSFAFTTKAGTHLSTPEGWKAELALSGWLHTEINVRHRELNPDTVTYLSTNRARRRLTLLIEANALTSTLDCHCKLWMNAACSHSKIANITFSVWISYLVIDNKLPVHWLWSIKCSGLCSTSVLDRL